MSDNNNNAVLSAEERKKKRLDAWRQKQQQQQVQNIEEQPKIKLSISLSSKKKKALSSSRKQKSFNPLVSLGDSLFQDDESSGMETKRVSHPLNIESPQSIKANSLPTDTQLHEAQSVRKRRWDTVAETGNKSTHSKAPLSVTADALDQFMEKLQAGALGVVHSSVGADDLAIDVGGSFVVDTYRAKSLSISGGAITAEDLEKIHNGIKKSETAGQGTTRGELPLYNPNEWLSDATDNEDDEKEEQARRELIEALKKEKTFTVKSHDQDVDNATKPAQLAAEVKSEKTRREERLRELEIEAEKARKFSLHNEPDVGRYLYDDLESGVMEEAERNLDAAKAAPDALTVLAELNKKKEIQAVDHSSIEYLPFTKNLYRVPRALASLKHEDIIDRRAKLKVRVRGHGAPAPLENFEQGGLSEAVLSILRSQRILEPYPIQAQCIPCIMAGRDVIGIAKTGSGKTLAYLLPLLRHILVQPPLADYETGPIGLILAPARELAFQIHSVCKVFAKQLGLKSIAVYGGAGVAEQIADLKRGAHIVTATPGRLIDILTMQSGKILSLKRVTYVVMDEADRMFDMGFAPQISALLAAVRPDRQTVLFSATFPKTIESLARKSLAYPLEVMVGGRSVASENVTLYAELVEEEDKFLRLLQILGDYVEGNKKVIVFVDTQVRADSLFEKLLRSGYSTLSLHGGKDQEDRDSTISDFKRNEGPNVLVATGVAGRGLDVQNCCCVVNFSAPNHLEAYVHQAGRTGRAGNKGVCFTLVNSTEEGKYAPIVVRALSEAGQSENVDPALRKLSDDFKAKVEKGEAKYAGSGFKGKGYTYDSSELNEAQRIARLEKRQALIEAGLMDPEDDDLNPFEAGTSKGKLETTETKAGKDLSGQIKIPDNLTPELLALPGMKEALLRTAGILSDESGVGSDNSNDLSLGHPVQTSDNHWVQEFEINDYPREARWKVTQKETTSRLQEEFRTAVTLKGSYFPPGKEPGENERKLYLHLEATSGTILRNGVLEISRLLNEETLRVSAKSTLNTSHKYNVLG